jgi:hypothetical protein
MNFKDLNLDPSDRELRIFSWIWLGGFALLGLLVAWRVGALASGVAPGLHAPWRIVVTLWGLAVVGWLVGIVSPRAIRPVYVAWTVAAFPIGWTVSLVLLALVYYVVFTGFGLLFRLAGRDVLGRKFDRAAATYWVKRNGTATGLERYFKQF